MKLGAIVNDKDNDRWVYVGKDRKDYYWFMQEITPNFDCNWTFRAKDDKTLHRKFPSLKGTKL